MSPAASQRATDDTGSRAGVDTARVTAWFAEHVDAHAGALAFDLIAGGRSNLTYRVTAASGARWILRRPPLGPVLATAHDMAREHRILSALSDTSVPVPATVGLCTDVDVTGAPFYVMELVEGAVVRDADDATKLSPAQRAMASESLVTVLAAIHSIDVDAVGLGDLGRHEGYIARQLARWYRQYEGTRHLPGAIDLPSVDTVHDRLTRSIPEQLGTSIVHGDYRLDNCMLAPDGSVAAVLDWELCTLGDPLADVGLLGVYWTDPDEVDPLPQASPTNLDGFLRRDEVLERYAETSGRDLRAIDFYMAFGYWKLTCIIAGVTARYAAGAMGADGDDGTVAEFATMTERLASLAEEATDRLRR